MEAASASSQLLSTARGDPSAWPQLAPRLVGWLIWCCPMMSEPSASSAPRLMWSSVRMTGSTSEPSGMRATRENRKMAASSDLPKTSA